jgi:superfamily II DNA/RNA helicase
MDKRHREEILAAFKAGTYRILVSTDLTSRGIDVQQMSLVINFDIPRCKQTYLHRIGRSGRWGRIGQAINMVSPRDITYMRDIEIFYKKQIDEFEL